MSDATIKRLIETHGEGGLAPTATDWRAIFTITGEVALLNLLAFKQRVETSKG